MMTDLIIEYRNDIDRNMNKKKNTTIINDISTGYGVDIKAKNDGDNMDFRYCCPLLFC